MRKFSKTGTVLGSVGLSAGVVMTTANVAHAVDFVSDAVNSLIGSNVSLDSGASLSNVGEVAAKYQGSSVGVVVVPELAVKNYSANQIAEQVLSGTGSQYKTIIVAVDASTDSFGVASVGGGSEIATILNSNSNGNAGETLVKNSDAIMQVAKTQSNTVTSTEVPTGSPTSPMEAVIGLSGGFLGAVILVVLGLTVAKKAGWLKRRVPNVKFSSKIYSDDFRVEAEALNAVRQKHYEFGSKRISSEIGRLMKETQVLFEMLHDSGNSDKLVEASVQYADIFKKLVIALGDKVYLKALKYPQYFENPSQLMKDGETALSVVNSQVVENIKQWNGRQNLEFRVALEALMSTGSENAVENIYNNTNEKGSATR